MRLPHFQHFAPATLDEACTLLASHGEGSLALAGGTDLLVKMKHRRVVPSCLVNIKYIAGLDRIDYDPDAGLRIGALVTIQTLKASNLVKRHAKLLHQAASIQSSIQIRNCATLGGNIGNASPAGDGPLALMVMNASVIVRSVDGGREVALTDFFLAPGKTVLRPGELIEAIRVPPVSPGTGVAYSKHALRRTDIAIVSVAVNLTLLDGICSEVRIGLGSVAPTIMRAPSAEKVLAGRSVDAALAEEAANAVVADATPIDDIRASARYRKQAVRESARAAILAALQDARTEGI